MKNIIIGVMTVVIISLGAIAASVTPKNKNILPAKEGESILNEGERRARWERNFMKRYGGLCVKPGSQKGKILFIDGQTIVNNKFIEKQTVAIEEFTRIKVEYAKNEKVSFGQVNTLIAGHAGQLSIFIMNDPNLPSVLIAPEANWAVINIHALNVGSPTSDLLEFRVRKEMWRAFAYASGCADSNDGRSIVQKVSSLADLDSIKVQNLDPIQMQGLIHNLRLIGITPKHVAPYKTACLRGWAPAPTNEYQKAIWDKVHAKPTAPIKIKPETKKVRE